MQVITVEQNDIINSFPNNSIIFNKETLSYFKKDPSIALSEDITYRDAILNQYNAFSRFLERKNGDDYIEYFDNNDAIKLLDKFGETDKIRNIFDDRIKSIDNKTIYFDLPIDIGNSYLQNKLSIDSNEYLSKFDRVIYVDQINGDDLNDGITSPVKSVRRAEKLIIENSAIVFSSGIYDITLGNPNSNPKYCQSGLAGNNNLSVEYINFGNVSDVLFVIYHDGLAEETRDLACVNGLKNENIKIINCSFKIIDSNRETIWGTSIARNSENIEFIDCVFDLKVKNGNIVNNITAINPVVFTNCIINLDKELVGSEIVDKPYTGYYSINNCFINSKIKNKIENLDRYNKNFKNDISLIDAIGMSFF